MSKRTLELQVQAAMMLTHNISHHCSKCDQPFSERLTPECPSCGNNGCRITWVKRGAMDIGDEYAN